MDEILPGLWHWTAHHPGIGRAVSSYYLETAGLVIDPKLPTDDCAAFFAERDRPQQIAMTIGLHDRDVQAVADAFGIPIRVSREGAERLGGAMEVVPFGDGDELATGVRAIRISVLAPDEYALHLAGPGALSIADSIIRYDGRLGFVPDFLLGDDPEAIKEGVKERFAALLELAFDALLFAHGDPLATGGKEELRAFVER